MINSVLRRANRITVTYLVQHRNPFQARRALILRPHTEELTTLVLDGRIREVRGAADTQTLQERLVGKGTLETWPSVLNQAIEKDESAKLTMNITILELLTDSTGSLAGARGLKLDDFYELRDAAEVFLLILLRGEVLDGDCNSRIRFLLEDMLAVECEADEICVIMVLRRQTEQHVIRGIVTCATSEPKA